MIKNIIKKMEIKGSWQKAKAVSKTEKRARTEQEVHHPQELVEIIMDVTACRR
jgi:hypothetical protein